MDVRDMLQAKGLRRTRARTDVLAILAEARRPLAHQEISGQTEAADLDRVTLYRTLTSLSKAGLVHQVRGVDGVHRFCAHGLGSMACPGNHPHFLCQSCGEMSCLEGQELPWVSVPAGARVTGKQMVIYGVCAQCRDAEA